MAPALRRHAGGRQPRSSPSSASSSRRRRARGRRHGWRPPAGQLGRAAVAGGGGGLRASAERLARRVGELGVAMRRPEVVSDGWTLMAELQAFRADFRARMGDLVYLTASAFEDVRREEVVPGAQAEMASAVALRVSVAELRRSLQGKLERAAAHGVPRAARARAAGWRTACAAFASLQGLAGAAHPATSAGWWSCAASCASWRASLRWRPQDVLALVQPFLAVLEGCPRSSPATGCSRRTTGPCGRRAGGGWSRRRCTWSWAHRAPSASSLEALERGGRALRPRGGLRRLPAQGTAAPGEGLEEAELRETLERSRERLAALPFSSEGGYSSCRPRAARGRRARRAARAARA